MQPDVVERARLDSGERLGHAVDERLDADEADLRLPRGFGQQVFAGAETDLQADAIDRDREQRGQLARRLAQVERQPRQQGRQQSGLARAELVALPAAEKGTARAAVLIHRGNSVAPPRRCRARPALRMTAGYFRARRSASARSVRSQEKPPSFSGARPKCP